jgi:hypothetical protein
MVISMGSLMIFLKNYKSLESSFRLGNKIPTSTANPFAIRANVKIVILRSPLSIAP